MTPYADEHVDTVTVLALDRIAAALARLARPSELSPPRLELSKVELEGDAWVAQVMADALRLPLVGFGPTPDAALRHLADKVDAYDWRRVKR